jgi:GTPase SAR1 family protein
MTRPRRLDVKAVMLGDSNVGKSCLLAAFDGRSFNHHMTQTMGFDFLPKVLTVNHTAAHVQVYLSCFSILNHE